MTVVFETLFCTWAHPTHPAHPCTYLCCRPDSD